MILELIVDKTTAIVIREEMTGKIGKMLKGNTGNIITGGMGVVIIKQTTLLQTLIIQTNVRFIIK